MSEDRQELLLQNLVLNPGRYWPEFLNRYTPYIRGVIRRRFHDLDDQMDAYVFCVEHIARNRMARIRKYLETPADSRGKFTTWLATVVGRLCVDWYRAENGRRVLPAAVKRITTRDQAVFRLHFWENRTFAEIVEALRHEGFPDASIADVDETVSRLTRMLPLAARLAGAGRGAAISLDADPGSSRFRAFDLADSRPGPVEIASRGRAYRALDAALDRLSDEDKSLVVMWFHDELKAREIAERTGMKTDQVFQRLKTIVNRLRRELGSRSMREDYALPGSH